MAGDSPEHTVAAPDRQPSVLDERLFTVSEVCAWLAISDHALRRLGEQRVLRAERIGGCVRIRRSELLRLLAAPGDDVAKEPGT